MENVLYEIEDYDDAVKTMDKSSTKSYLKDFADEIKSIKKTYRFGKKIYRMTLFSVDHQYLSHEYIEHYQSLPDMYGKDVLSEFDISIIKKLN
jgi:hypothetical protein